MRVSITAIESKRWIKTNNKVCYNNDNLLLNFDYHINIKGCTGIKVLILLMFLIIFTGRLFLLNNIENTVYSL